MEGKFGGLYKYACKVLNFFEPDFFVAENVTALGLGTATKASEGDIVAKFNSSKLFDGYSFTEEWEVDGAAMNMKLPGWTDNDARTKIILLNAPDAYEQIVEFMKNNPI